VQFLRLKTCFKSRQKTSADVENAIYGTYAAENAIYAKGQNAFALQFIGSVVLNLRNYNSRTV